MNFRQVHLDFHTSEKIDGIGAAFSKEQFQKALKAGHVNSITVFSKCHHGWAYHPSKANIMHPNLKFDLLGAQIEAAHEIGVKTPVYLSAGLDEKTAKAHPEWLNRDENDAPAHGFNKPGYHLLCMNTPYLDYLLAQIKEVCELYDADGIFLDIVGVRRCCCKYCRETLEKEGKNPFDEKNIAELGERVYANYTRRVRETIDSVKPGLNVFHNGGHIRHGRRDLAFMNTHLELESLPTGGWGYDHFPLSARYVQSLGMDFLGMTGKFHESWGEFGGFKHKNALRYEAALSAANGAKISVGDQMHPCGLMDMATYNTIGAAYKEIEEKEPWLDNVTPITQVALLSPEALENEDDSHDTGNRCSNTAAGAVRMLLEGKYMFDVVDGDDDYSDYDVIILGDNAHLSERIKSKVDAFVKNGGKILATGTSALDKNNSFIYDLGAKYRGASEFNPTYLKAEGLNLNNLYDASYVIYANASDVSCTGKELAKLEAPYFNRTFEHFSSHKHAPNSSSYPGSGITEGKDGIYIAWEIFSEYATHGSLIAKETVLYALDRLLGKKKIFSSNLGAQAVVTLMRQENENRYVNHLLYASPVKRGNGVEIIEDILPVYETDVSLTVKEKIKNVYLAPQNIKIPFTQNENILSYHVDKFECHQMVVLEY